MRLDLAELLQRVGLQRTFPFELPPIVADELVCVAPVTGSLTFTNTGSALIVRGAARATVRMECSRCLAPFETPLEASIDEQYPLTHRQVHAQARHRELVVEEDDDEQTGGLFIGPMFDVGELLRQLLELELPLQPLHAPDCAGLCAQCGRDLNDGPCGCRASSGDPRLARLGALLDAEE